MVRMRKSQLIDEKGIALVTVLVLSLISLGIVATLAYLVIQGTRTSGFHKRYATALEASYGGTEIVAAFAKNRGKLVIPISTFFSGSNFPKSCDCNDPDVVNDNLIQPDNITAAGVYDCLCRKLCDPTSSWQAACSNTFDPTATPDMQVTLQGVETAYQVSAKIVDTTLGNSDLSGESLGGQGVVSSTAGMISAPPSPYLYRIEINSQNTKTAERSRLSALYAY